MFSGPIYRFIALIWLTLPASTLLAKEVTILYTNDIESVYEPVEASWRDDMQRMGGMARLATLLDQERSRNPATFTVDAGDIFTGSLSKATQGALVFDLYSAMGYDAVNLGNHEYTSGKLKAKAKLYGYSSHGLSRLGSKLGSKSGLSTMLGSRRGGGSGAPQDEQAGNLVEGDVVLEVYGYILITYE